MDPRSALLLVATALCWGGSFVFIKVGVEELHPVLVMSFRCALGGALLWLVIALNRARGTHPAGVVARGRDAWRRLAVNGALTGVPLSLVGIAERSIDSGFAGVMNASVPLWAGLLAIRWDRDHPTTSRTMVGLAIGFAGVVLLTASRGAIAGSGEVVGLLVCTAAAALYAVSGIFVRERLRGTPPLEIAAWSVTWAAVLLTVPGLLAEPLPASLSAEAVTSLVLLAVLGTFLAYACYYELLDRVGATRAALVTYLLPPLAVASGAIMLDEEIRPESITAMLVILFGVWHASRRDGAVVSDAGTGHG